MLPVHFIKPDAQRFLDALENGKPIPPAGEWDTDKVLTLAGVCDPAPVAWTRGLVSRQVTSSAGPSQVRESTENASVHGCWGAARSGALRSSSAARRSGA